MTKEEFAEMQKKALEQLRSGQSLSGKDGVFAPHKLEEKWGKKYPIVIRSWRANWLCLSSYFDYSPEIRRLIYTTNAVEGFHRQIRKVTKTKGPFTSDMALIKIIYLAYCQIKKKWTSPLQNWALTIQQLSIRFGDRVKIDLIT